MKIIDVVKARKILSVCDSLCSDGSWGSYFHAFLLDLSVLNVEHGNVNQEGKGSVGSV